MCPLRAAVPAWLLLGAAAAAAGCGGGDRVLPGAAVTAADAAVDSSAAGVATDATDATDATTSQPADPGSIDADDSGVTVPHDGGDIAAADSAVDPGATDAADDVTGADTPGDAATLDGHAADDAAGEVAVDAAGDGAQADAADATLPPDSADAERGGDAGSDDHGDDGADDGAHDACAPACEERVCGSDGCGGVCGQCLGAEICRDGACLDPATLVGDRCDNPLTVGPLPFSVDGDTRPMLDAHDSSGCAAPVLGRGARDVVYRFVAPDDAVYAAEVAAEQAFWRWQAVYIRAGCGTLGTSCVASSPAEPGSATSRVEARLVAGGEYFVVVDNTAASRTPYRFSLTVSRVGP